MIERTEASPSRAATGCDGEQVQGKSAAQPSQDESRVTHVMVDLETLGTRPGAAVDEIALAVFDPVSGAVADCYYGPVSVETDVEAGGVVDAETVAWRFANPRRGYLKDRTPAGEIARGVSAWIEKHVRGRARWWSKGVDFDFPILLEFMKRNLSDPFQSYVPGWEAPWRYNELRDVRTVLEVGDLLEVPYPKAKPAHSAARDVRLQIRQVAAVMGFLASGAKRERVVRSVFKEVRADLGEEDWEQRREDVATLKRELRKNSRELLKFQQDVVNPFVDGTAAKDVEDVIVQHLKGLDFQQGVARAEVVAWVLDAAEKQSEVRGLYRFDVGQHEPEWQRPELLKALRWACDTRENVGRTKDGRPVWLEWSPRDGRDVYAITTKKPLGGVERGGK